MAEYIILGFLSIWSWQGCYVGVERTAQVAWRNPVYSASSSVNVGAGRVGLRVMVIQPLDGPGHRPSIQLGGSVRVF